MEFIMKTKLTPLEVSALTTVFEHYNLKEIVEYALEAKEYILLLNCMHQTKSLPLSMISKDHSANMLNFFSTELFAKPNHFKEVKDLNGNTPLHWAALNGHIDMVTSLLENGADVQSKEDFGRTPLHFSAIGGHHEVCKALIEAGAELNSVEIDGFSPLMVAISANCVTQDDLDAGINFYSSPAKHDYAGVDVTFNNGQKQSDVAKELIEQGCILDLVGLDNTSAISLATKLGYQDIVDELVSRSVTQTIEGEAIEGEAIEGEAIEGEAIEGAAPADTPEAYIEPEVCTLGDAS